MATYYNFCVKYYDTENPFQIHEKNFYRRTDAPDEYLQNCVNHCSKMDNFRELLTSFYHKVEL